MSEYDPSSTDRSPTELGALILTWLACGCIWAIHLTTIPFAGRQYAGRSKSNRDAINLHKGFE